MKLYRHYKQKFYKYLGEARHSENEELVVIYDCLYPNASGQTWVRPKAMFHEIIEHEGVRRPRFEHVPLEITATSSVGPAELEILAPLITEALGSFDAEPFDAESFTSTLRNHPRIFLLVARIDGAPVGFKLGYELSAREFYSWLGGVSAEFRGLGIAAALMKEQHEWCRAQGYATVQTKTLNHFWEMLILNLKNGFEIHGTSTSSRGLKLLLQKKL